jgi:uncharacterized membrane protein
MKLRFSRESVEFGRAVGFIDATYALALTLLVTALEINDPVTSWNSPADLFDAIGPQFIAFLVAFATIADYWLNNHRLVASFTAIDYPVIVAHLLLVGAIVLLPFSTQSVGDPEISDLPLPTAVMAANVVAASGFQALVYVLAVRRGLFTVRPTRRQTVASLVGSLDVAVVFAVSIPVAYLVSVGAAQLCWLSLVVIAPIARYLSARMYRNAGGRPPRAARRRQSPA